jgi:pimeloyl-ACP methyl ester carboxylesterase
MPTFSSYDGTELAYHLIGEGKPLICLPGGAMRASEYLGDYGGLSAHRQLVLLDHRGTGDSPEPADVESYRCDRVVADVEALRAQLGLKKIDLLTHSAGANLGILYMQHHPERVARLALITPGMRTVGIRIDEGNREAATSLRKNEPWYDEAIDAFRREWIDEGSDEDYNLAGPFWYGRWDDIAQEHYAAGATQLNSDARAAHYAEGAFDPEATKAAIARLDIPVLILAGELDFSPSPVLAAQLAELFTCSSSCSPGPDTTPGWTTPPGSAASSRAGSPRADQPSGTSRPLPAQPSSSAAARAARVRPATACRNPV